MRFGRDKSRMVTSDEALPGRTTPLRVPEVHVVSGHRIQPPFPDGVRTAVFGMGCFWGAERLFWQTPGVYSTAVGYAGGFTENPTYEETCSGRTGHAEVVLVVYDPAQVSYTQLLTVFWEGHDPTQGMRQGNDRGTQYRSAIYWTDDAQREAAEASTKAYGDALRAARHGAVTTEIAPLRAFYYAEDYHQQYLVKVPNGYCGLGGTGVSCPVGGGVTVEDDRRGSATGS
jgi:peptide-methionine (S)-S-oxide reductase